jgi:CDGSH-type Zn-finger protein
MSEEAVIAAKSPFAVELVEGKTYYWCACGRSKNQPYCDGSHQGTGFEPVAFTAEKTGTAYLCGCKRTANGPFCDGTHNKLQVGAGG